ncbi:MAG: glycosyltransferase family 2 protein [Candidatus Aenigmarchaeota archaeon]|nr:glycosyltransferase family 2 protein [Candidatus Aenigmarchaeota archaeon]
MSRFAIIPAYNEEKNIGQVLKEVKKLGVTPIVVDDGSTDDTFGISKKNGAITIRHERNKGKGESIKSGIDYLLKHHPDFTCVVLMDADMQYHPKEAMAIFNALEKNKSDFVMGHRNWEEVPLRHQLGNFVWRNAFNILFGTSLKDTNCGLIGISRNAIEKIKGYIIGGYVVDNSILIGVIKNKLKIDQVPVKVVYHRKSGVTRGITIVAGVLIYIVKEGLKYRLGRKR